MQVETSIIAADLVSTTASVSRPAPRSAPREAAAEFTLAQRAARYGLTALAIVALSALFATQIAAVLR
jgi:hypothetical protein